VIRMKMTVKNIIKIKNGCICLQQSSHGTRPRIK
jgi:hypothetical protein